MAIRKNGPITEASERFQNSKVASLKNLLQNANKQLNKQKYLKQKTVRLIYKTDITLITPLHPPLLECSFKYFCF